MAKEGSVGSTVEPSLAMYRNLLVHELIPALGFSPIAGTPVPISYSRHSSRVVSMFTLMLPLALVGIMDSVPGTVLSTTVISWFLFGIEVIGHNIE